MKIFNLLLFFVTSIVFWYCSSNRGMVDPNKTNTTAKSVEKKIIGTPIINGISGLAVNYDNQNFIYILTVPFGTNIRALTLKIDISAKATISPNPAIERDYTDPISYTVTAEDGSFQIYTVIISIKQPEIVGKTCLVSRIENVDSKEYIDFKYDNKGRVIKINAMFAATNISDQAYPTSLNCSYSESGDLVQAESNGLSVLEGKPLVYKPIYQNGKLIRVSMDHPSIKGSIIIGVDEQNRIVNLDFRSCYKYLYSSKSAIYQITSCGGVVYDKVEYSEDVRHFLAGQSKYPGFLTVFHNWFLDFDNAEMLHQFFGEYIPTKRTHYYYPGSAIFKRNTMSYKKNSEGFPTEMKVWYETKLNTDFPRGVTYNYKILYNNCQ